MSQTLKLQMALLLLAPIPIEAGESPLEKLNNHMMAVLEPRGGITSPNCTCAIRQTFPSGLLALWLL